MFPRIPVPPRNINDAGGFGALPSSARGATTTTATTTGMNYSVTSSGLDALLPPLTGAAAKHMSRRSKRLLDDIRSAAQVLDEQNRNNSNNVVADDNGDGVEVSSRTASNNSIKSNKKLVASGSTVISSGRSFLVKPPPPSSSSKAVMNSAAAAAASSIRTPRVTASGGTVGVVKATLSSSSSFVESPPSASASSLSASTTKHNSSVEVDGIGSGTGGSLTSRRGGAASYQQRLEALEQQLLMPQQRHQQQQPQSGRLRQHDSSALEMLEQMMMMSTNRTTSSSSKPTAQQELQQQAPAAKQQHRGMSPESAVREWGHLLAPHELEEIRKYRTVYFAGLPEVARRKTPAVDDEHADYRVMVGDHCAFRYEFVSPLGKGSFGQVFKCFDHKHNTQVALKIIKNKKKFHEQARIERDILEYLNKHATGNSGSGAESVFLRLRDSFLFRGHVVMVCDLYGMSLYDQLKANSFAATAPHKIRAYAQQLLVALDFCSQHSIVHCDLKPENILIARGNAGAAGNAIRVIDFGSSCFVSKRLHTYIQSRFYRAPEIVLGIPYSCAIDMWSLGCMLVELHTGNPLFPAQSENELLGMITARIGPVPTELLDKAPRRKHFYEASGNTLRKTRPAYSRMHAIPQLFPARSPHGLDLLADLVSRMVRWNPVERITPAEALQHPFFKIGVPAPPSAPPKSSTTVRRKVL